MLAYKQKNDILRKILKKQAVSGCSLAVKFF